MRTIYCIVGVVLILMGVAMVWDKLHYNRYGTPVVAIVFGIVAIVIGLRPDLWDRKP